MLVFAYDGSLNGDWVAHYAVCFAAAMPGRQLRLLHVYDEQPVAELAPRIARIAEECALLGVELQTELQARAHASVVERLMARLPRDPDTIVIVGTRSRPRDRAFLAGTVAAALFAVAPCGVIAMRVLHPAALGQPGRVLLALTGEPRAARQAFPLLRILGPDLRQLHLLIVRELSRLRFRLLRPTSGQRLLNVGHRVTQQIEEELRTALAAHPHLLDTTVVVSDDAPKEILACAARLRSRLICLGTAASALPRRLHYGHPLERILRETPCDVAVYRTIE
jgi:nucleotide-binding universal stress UspA family protein